MKSPLLTLAQWAIALLLASPMMLLAVYGVATYAEDRDLVTLMLGGVFAVLGGWTFYTALRCVGQGPLKQTPAR